MTDPTDVLLDRAQLERAFTKLGDRLVRRGVVADIFVVGGAAMALAYDATRVTRDVEVLARATELRNRALQSCLNCYVRPHFRAERLNMVLTCWFTICGG